MKIFVTFCVLVVCYAFFVPATYACDGCGPSSGCNYVGVLPQFRKNFIGLRWNDRSFITKPYYISPDELAPKSTDRYYALEIWGRYFVHPKVQLIGILPYAYHTRNEGSKTDNIQGVGDAVLLGNYSVYTTADTSYNEFKHQFQLGAGVKLPTGKYDNLSNGHIYHANFQIGSGSTDLIASATYTVRYRKFGMRNDVGYKFNTTNKADYKFGDKISHNASLFYWGSFDGDNAIVPQIGIYQEFARQDVSNGFYEANTGGTTRMLNLAADVYYSRFSFGINAMLPVQQPQYDIPMEMKHSLRFNLNYFF